MFFIFVAMSPGLVGASGMFPMGSLEYKNIFSGSSDSDFSNLTGNVTGTSGHLSFGEIWMIGTGMLTGASLIFSILTKTTNMLAVWIFGSVFWSSWLSINGLLALNGFLSNPMGLILIGMIDLGMVFMFVAAVNGMLSGSIWMR